MFDVRGCLIWREHCNLEHLATDYEDIPSGVVRLLLIDHKSIRRLCVRKL